MHLCWTALHHLSLSVHHTLSSQYGSSQPKPYAADLVTPLSFTLFWLLSIWSCLVHFFLLLILYNPSQCIQLWNQSQCLCSFELQPPYLLEGQTGLCTRGLKRRKCLQWLQMWGPYKATSVSLPFIISLSFALYSFSLHKWWGEMALRDDEAACEKGF